MTAFGTNFKDGSCVPGFFNDGSAPGISLTSRRMYVWAAAGPKAALPVAGGDVDFIAQGSVTYTDPNTGLPVTVQPTSGLLALPGIPVQVEAGGSFSSGANLMTDSSGRAVLQTGTNKIILRALEASAGSGNVVAAVFTSGR